MNKNNFISNYYGVTLLSLYLRYICISQAIHIRHDNVGRLECLVTCTNTVGCSHVSVVGSTCNVHTTTGALLTTSEHQNSIVIYKYEIRKLKKCQYI